MAQMEVGGVSFETDALEEMTIDQMVTVYNTISGKEPVGRFRDKATGLAALRDALEKQDAQPVAATTVEESIEQPEGAQTLPHGREFRPLYGPDDVIYVMVAENPKRPGSSSAERFAKYRDGMTVKEALYAGLKRDLAWDWEHRFISVHKPAAASNG